jgi:hypothetical protein
MEPHCLRFPNVGGLEKFPAGTVHPKGAAGVIEEMDMRPAGLKKHVLPCDTGARQVRRQRGGTDRRCSCSHHSTDRRCNCRSTALTAARHRTSCGSRRPGPRRGRTTTWTGRRGSRRSASSAWSRRAGGPATRCLGNRVAPTSCSCHGSRGLVVGCRCRCRWARGWAHYLFMTNSWNFFFYSQWVGE